MAARLFDTHLHLDHEQFESKCEEVVARAADRGVGDLVAVGIDLDSSRASMELAKRFEGVWAAVGIQPNHCAKAKSEDWDQIVALAEGDRVVALGETGLDLYWDFSPFDRQQDYFDRHLRLSQALDLPFIVHMRDCGEEVLGMLEEARSRGPLRGVMHSYTGDLDLARSCLDLGLYISFAGMVTFKKSGELREVAAAVPRDRLLLETDAPFLSPHPHRGQRPNEPALLVHTAACLAETRGESFEELARTTTENARNLFDRAKS